MRRESALGWDTASPYYARPALTRPAIVLTIQGMYRLEYTEGMSQDLQELRATERKRILDTIDVQLTYNPAQETRNKKVVVGLKPPWEHEEPVRELRVGKYRVFYDVDEEGQRVIVRALREKPPHRTTEEIL